MRNVRIYFRIIFFLLIIQNQGCHCMITKSTIIIKAGFHIPITCFACSIRILHICIFSKLTISNTTVIHQYRSVCSNRPTRTDFINCKRAVIRSLHFKRKSFSQEVHFLIQNHIHIQRIVAGLAESISIISHTCTSSKW